MNTILIMIASAILAIEICYSSVLAYDVKKFLRVDKTPTIVEATSKVDFWNKLFNKKYILISWLLVIPSSIYKKLIQLLNCPYCLVSHLVFWNSYLYMNNTIYYSILLALLTIGITHIVEKYIYE